MCNFNEPTPISLAKNNDKRRFKNQKLAWIRRERAKEALFCLKLMDHEVSKGNALDVGCGHGYVTDYFLGEGINTIGLDLSVNALLKAKIFNPFQSLILASGVDLPFKDNSFHTVILNDVLEHINYGDGKFMMRQIRNILWPKGKLYISVANKYQIREPHTLLFFITWLPKKLYDPIIRKLHNKGPFYPYTVKRLKNLCNEIGFINENFTWVYASKKVFSLKYIGDKVTKKFIKFLRDIKLSNKILLFLAEKFSVILFVCER